MLAAPTQRWMFIQQASVLTPSMQWCEYAAEEPNLDWEVFNFTGTYLKSSNGLQSCFNHLLYL